MPVGHGADFHAWSIDQAQRLRARAATGLDWDNLAEEIESVGRADRNEIYSRLIKLLSHLLKWQFQPERRSNSWRATLLEQRLRIARTIEASPSLRGLPAAFLDETYRIARLEAAGETDLPADRFPDICPYSVSDVLAEYFLPEGDPSGD
ncbi:DUF29 domain-containing protein [Methylobrevis pamukkalensis]|uniref:DUF29 domain-containing protein n=1 Tax=Methylobrevis pamukkalensis TaxID=1439726 RepID=UPI001471F34C|nr:DUF29 domain-containing protein [Methylobrevis pamukkalensis]